MPITTAYVDFSAPGVGLVAIFLSLTFVGLLVNVTYLLLSKHTHRQCNDAMTAALVAGFIGDLMPGLGLVDALHRGITSQVNFILIATCATALIINTTLAVAVFLLARKQLGRLSA